MNEFLFIFRGGNARRAQQSQEGMQTHMKQWMTWMESLGKQDILIGGQPLEAGGKMVKGKGKIVTDGPYAEGKELVGGYLLIKAENIDEAAKISKGCPIFEFDGTVEVRPIQKMNM